MAEGWWGGAVIRAKFTKIVWAIKEGNAELPLPKSHHATNQQATVDTSK